VKKKDSLAIWIDHKGNSIVLQLVCKSLFSKIKICVSIMLNKKIKFNTKSVERFKW